jgi:hypothetical protein
MASRTVQIDDGTSRAPSNEMAHPLRRTERALRDALFVAPPTRNATRSNIDVYQGNRHSVKGCD